MWLSMMMMSMMIMLSMMLLNMIVYVGYFCVSWDSAKIQTKEIDVSMEETKGT